MIVFILCLKLQSSLPKNIEGFLKISGPVVILVPGLDISIENLYYSQPQSWNETTFPNFQFNFFIILVTTILQICTQKLDTYTWVYLAEKVQVKVLSFLMTCFKPIQNSMFRITSNHLHTLFNCDCVFFFWKSHFVVSTYFKVMVH